MQALLANGQYIGTYQSEDFIFHYNPDTEPFIRDLDSTLSIELKDVQMRVNYFTNNPIDILLSSGSGNQPNIYSQKNKVNGKIILKRKQIKLDILSNYSQIVANFRYQAVQILVDEMMFGGAFQDQVKNSNLINLPNWVLPGLYHYIAYEWDVSTDNKMRFIQEEYDLRNFNQIPTRYDKIKGASFWKYLEQTYGEYAIPNMLYMARLSRKFNGAIYYAYMEQLVNIYKGWEKYFRLAYESDQMKMNPVGGHIIDVDQVIDIYVLSQNEFITMEQTPYGITIFKHDVNGERKQKIYRLPQKDKTLAPFGGSLNVVNNVIWLLTYRDSVSVFTCLTENGEVISEKDIATKITSYRLVNEELWYTSSAFNHSEVFRLGDKLPVFEDYGYINSFDIRDDKLVYVLDTDDASHISIYDIDSMTIHKLVSSSQNTIRQVLFTSDSTLLYNANLNGVWNGMLFDLQSNESSIVTNYRSSILFHQYKDSIFSEYLDRAEKSSIYISDALSLSDFYEYDTIYPTYFYSGQKSKSSRSNEPEILSLDSLEEYSFQPPIHPDFDFVSQNYDSLNYSTADYDIQVYKAIEKDVYSLYSAHLALTNSPQNSNIVRYSENMKVLLPNKLNLSIGGSLSDQYENTFIGGDFTGLLQAGARDISFYYQRNSKNLWNVQFLNRRRIFYEVDQRDAYRTSILDAEVSRPVSHNGFISSKLQFRNDRFDPLSLSEESYSVAPSNSWVASYLSSFNLGFETYKNKVLGKIEVGPRVDLEELTYAVDVNLSIAYHHKVSSYLEYDGLIRAGSSQGSAPVFYVIGGSSTDLLSEYTDRNYSEFKNPVLFQNIYGVRGFDVNHRNGNTFFNHNSQFSLSLVRLVFDRPIASEFFANLKLTGFLDLATAFYGKSIYDRSNVLSERTVESPTGAVRTEVRSFKNPFIFSNGFGLSTKAYGYVISLDRAWGFEDQKYQSPMWHLGLGLPF